MNSLFAAAQEICRFMEERRWRYCIIGGLAVIRWGEPRTTRDVDLTLLSGLGQENIFVDALLAKFKPRIDDAGPFAITNRVLLIHASNGRPVDIALGALPFEEQMISRSTNFEFSPGVLLPTASAEDLFIMKAFASRGRDWSDARNIAVRQKGKLDSVYILNHLKQLSLLKESPEILVQAMGLLEGKL
ncbi:MAG: nucleotidyl transferase AbiEii/AbiGii toxin family protein [Myxococcota bacterium]|jgi:hypothetical protein